MKAEDFIAELKNNSITSFYGVPDSLLKNVCAYITDTVDSKHNIITANEGNAIALACGYYLATEKIATVYMQNSGLGNCVNPLLSLSDEDVYNIPFLMLVGWRGEPGIKDEPQHVKQGKITDALLDTMGVKYSILPQTIEETVVALKDAIDYMQKTKKPYAFLIKKDTFENYALKTKRTTDYELSREEAISIVTGQLQAKDIVVSTTGQISRELYEIRENNNQSHQSDFLTVGSMGHASSIALGIAIEKPSRMVYCFDGDGAFLMHMGALPVIAAQNVQNLKHIVFNNEAHDSVGGQPTCANGIRMTDIAENSGYKKAFSVKTKEELEKILPQFIALEGMALLEIKVACGSRKDLGRPKEKPVENKNSFMEFLR